MSDVPSIRQKRRWFAARPAEPESSSAPATPPGPRRFSGLATALVLALATGLAWLAWASLATTPDAAPAPEPPPMPSPTPTVQVPRLSVAPTTTNAPPTIGRVHPEPADDHKGCFVLVGSALPFSGYHTVQRPRGTYLTVTVPLLCTTGEDLQLQLLLDCPSSRTCRPTGLFSRATRDYYSVPADDLELLYKAGTPATSYPTHLLVLRPTRLKKYASWGIQ